LFCTFRSAYVKRVLSWEDNYIERDVGVSRKSKGIHVMTRLTWLTLRGLVSTTDWDLARRPGAAGVAGVPGELGTDALLAVSGFTVPEAVRFEPAVDVLTQGLPGNGFHWELAAERGTTGVVAVDMTAGGDPGVEGIGVFLSSHLGVMVTGSLRALPIERCASGGWTDSVGRGRACIAAAVIIARAGSVLIGGL
jgi:hypothetical protein